MYIFINYKRTQNQISLPNIDDETKPKKKSSLVIYTSGNYNHKSNDDQFNK